MDPLFATAYRPNLTYGSPNVAGVNPSLRSFYGSQAGRGGGAFDFPVDYQGPHHFGDFASGADSNADLWGSRPMSDDQYTLALNQALFKKQRAAALKAQQAEAMRKIKLFDTLSPDEIAGLYDNYNPVSGQSTGPVTEEQAIVRGMTPTKYSYDDLTKRNQENQTRFEHGQLFSRQIRDSDVNSRLNQEAALRTIDESKFQRGQNIKNDARNERKLVLDEQAQAQNSADRQAKIQELSLAHANEDATRKYRNAVNAIADGGVRTEAEIDRNFPELSNGDRATLKGLLRSNQADAGDVQQQAQDYSRRFRKIQKEADALPRTDIQDPYRDTPWYLPNWAVGAGTGIKDPTAPKYLPNFIVGGGSDPALGPRPITAAEQAYIDGVKKDSKGSIVYDPALKSFVPVQSISRMLPSAPVARAPVSQAYSPFSTSPADPSFPTGLDQYSSPMRDEASGPMFDRPQVPPFDQNIQTLNRVGAAAPVGNRQNLNGVIYIKTRNGWQRL